MNTIKSKNNIMKNTLVTALFAIVCVSCGSSHEMSDKENNLKNLADGKFLVGVALNSHQAAANDENIVNLVNRNFNSVVAENCMKCEVIHPEEGKYDFTLADEFIKFAEDNDMHTVGHCLIWHSQLAPWFCIDEEGKDVSADVLKQRMKDHIHTVVSRYKGKVHGWDVVNEAIEGNGDWRKSKFYEILGPEYIEYAFRYAHEADPDAELYYNDYGMNEAGRRDKTVEMIKNLQSKGIRIDAVGMQGHMGLDYPSLSDFETSIKAFASTGVKVMITEWDMSALPTINRGANISETVDFQKLLNPYPVALPDSIDALWNKRMGEFFTLFVKHSDVITRVTAWGLTDEDSWKNNWPMQGRKDYPLLFDRDYEPKPFIMDLFNSGCNNIN